jgi:hypothetical protein
MSARILRAWMPAIHAGMTEAANDHNAVEYWRWDASLFSCSAGERKFMTYFAIKSLVLFLRDRDFCQ